jgi:hypothetical protein
MELGIYSHRHEKVMIKFQESKAYTDETKRGENQRKKEKGKAFWL